MTMVFQKACPRHRTRRVDDDLVVAMDGDSGQVRVR